ncbi:MAG TPA: tetratricopeptide repeat protein [Pyrinomonadaceae bacterium]|nr:tetratricopeptide repeat protein [Pyrinomonadaceae bacterium]
MAFDKAKAIRAAEKYLAQNKIQAAIQEYRRIVEHDADDYTALNTLGDLYARLNERQYAVTCYRRVAEHYREQGFGGKAVAVYKKITRLHPDDPETALALAALYEQQGLMVDARAQLLSAADAYTRAGDSRASLEVLRRIADLDPSNTDIRLRLAEGYAAENLSEEAAAAYTEAGGRLAARGEHERALDAFNRALAIRPALHAALQGMLAAHSALGTADDAAEVLEQAVAARPTDTELRAMLARAYVEAESAVRAERATEDLVNRDASSFTLFFDVVRLYLQQGAVGDAARLLGRVAEQALAGRQDATLLELLQEVLARDPEQLEALRLLVRAYAWQRDEERLRTALERLADAAESAGASDEERHALAQLTRLAPAETRFAARLEALGGPLPEDAAAAAAAEVPSFESFMLGDDAFAAPPPPSSGGAEFEWNSVAQPAAGEAPRAEVENIGEAGEVAYDFTAAPQPEAASSFQEIDFGFDASAPAGPGGAGAEQMLLQELESVDFYVEQGYLDIARDTLDMLEKQYGSHPGIDERRARLPADLLGSFAPAANGDASAADAAGFVDFGAYEITSAGPPPAETAAPAAVFEPAAGDAAPPAESAQTQPPAAAPPAEAATRAGIDPGLAAIFDEFREAVEEPAAADTDYDTHFQTGLAYREMGLLDQAVEEFQAAANLSAPGDGTPRFLQCCNLLGHCFMQKGVPRAAAVWFKKGLEAPGHSEDEYQALRYDLGAAYEQMGDTARAIEVLSEVYAIDVSYRGVAERLRELQSQKK